MVIQCLPPAGREMISLHPQCAEWPEAEKWFRRGGLCLLSRITS
jgi:hypothetical protein